MYSVAFLQQIFRFKELYIYLKYEARIPTVSIGKWQKTGAKKTVN